MSVIDDFKNSSDDEKFVLLEEIEFEDVPEKWQLLHAVIANPDEYDLARVQALKILEIAGVPEAELPSLCDLLVAVIRTDKDYDVKNYAVMASKNFVNDSDELKQLIIEIVSDVEEDTDIRHNAYAAVRAFWDLPGRKAVLERLAADKEFGKIAAIDLVELHGSGEE